MHKDPRSDVESSGMPFAQMVDYMNRPSLVNQEWKSMFLEKWTV